MRRLGLICVLCCIGVPGLLALGQKDAPPTLPVETPPPTFLAPANPDAAQKTLVVPFAPQASAGRVLMSWTFTVYDSAGREVWSKTETQSQDRGFFGELFNLGPKPSVEIPSQLLWDGTDSKSVVGNGVYTYVLSVTDSVGQTTRTPPYSLTVQNAPVQITKLAADYSVFSPRGKRNTLTILQAGTREARWEGQFTTMEGAVVRTLVWENATDQSSDDLAPAPFAWDGRDDSGQVLPEGEYRYTLKGTNRAGASASEALGHPIVISERPGVLRLTSDQSAFSPQADKTWPKVLTLRTDSGNDEGLTDWAVTILDPAHPRVALWSKSGKAPLPPTVTFEGKDQLGRLLPDGRYQAVVSANFNNGNTGESPAFVFDIDTVAPQGNLKSAQTVFGGPGRPTLAIDFVGDGNVDWILEVIAGGKSARTFPLGTIGKASVELSGSDDTGKSLPDGTYTLRAATHDRAGNLGAVELAVVKDSRPRKVGLSASAQVVVPGDRDNGRITVKPEVDFADTVEKAEWTVTPLDAKGEGKALVPLASTGSVKSYDWAGQDASGVALADGNYKISLAVTWLNGASATADTVLRVDSEYLKKPKGTLTSSWPVFGGTERPSVTVKFQGDPGLEWTLDLRDPAGKVRARYPLGTTGSATVVVPASDTALTDGTYTLEATAKSKADVMGLVALSLKKDSRPVKASLDLSRTVLVPGKGTNALVRITPLLDVLDSIEAVSLKVFTSSGDLWAEQKAEGPLTFWDWNGQNSSGKGPADGTYRIDLEVGYTNGTLARAMAELRVDSTWLTEPQGTLTVSAPVFGAAARPVVTASLTADAGPVWTLDVVDKNGKLLRQYTLGDKGRAEVEIGTDGAGRPLPDGTYTLRATSANKAGLKGTATTAVTMDSRSPKPSLDLSTPVLVPGNVLNGSVKISPLLDVLDSVVTTTLTITDPEGRQVDEKTWEGLIPFWDWEGKDALGKRSADGVYQVALKVAYANGALGQARQTLKIDSTYLKEPQGTLTASDAVFGGSGRAGVTVIFQGNAGLAWTLEVLDREGKTIRKDSLGSSGQATVDFQGLDSANQPLPDGPYTLRASAISIAGIPGTALLQLQKDSRQGTVSVDLSRTIIVPGKGANATVRITPILEVVDSVDKTVLTVLGPDGKTVGEKSSDGFLPFWDWDGKDSQGKNLPNGAYQVALTVNYANGSTARSRSEVKIDSTYLNDSGPLVEMALSSRTFAPNNVDGPTDLTVTIKTTEGVVPVSNWQMVVLDPRGKTFRQWSGKGLPPKSVYWDGKGDNGDLVESGEDYQLQLKVSDTQNHVTRKQETVTIDISVIKLAEGRYKIIVSSIQFAGNSSDIFKVQGDLLTKNLFILKRLANALGKFPGYKIRLEGYAVSEYWNDPKSAEREQKTQLLPLSLDRAQSVKSVMVLLGIDTERFTVQGFGGNKPVVPHGDLENRWKNRRVEFYLDKN